MRYRIVGVVVASLIAVGCLHAGEPEAQYARGIVLSTEDSGGFLCVQDDTTGIEHCGECRIAEIVKQCEKAEAGDYAEGEVADSVWVRLRVSLAK